MVRRGSFAFGHYKGERVFRSRHPPCSTPDGGRRRGRTWNPMIKSRQQAVLVQRSCRHVHVSSGIEIAIEFSFVGIEGCREGAIGSHRTFGGSSRESATAFPHTTQTYDIYSDRPPKASEILSRPGCRRLLPHRRDQHHHGAEPGLAAEEAERRRRLAAAAQIHRAAEAEPLGALLAKSVRPATRGLRRNRAECTTPPQRAHPAARAAAARSRSKASRSSWNLASASCVRYKGYILPVEGRAIAYENGRLPTCYPSPTRQGRPGKILARRCLFLTSLRARPSNAHISMAATGNQEPPPQCSKSELRSSRPASGRGSALRLRLAVDVNTHASDRALRAPLSRLRDCRRGDRDVQARTQ
jgi:hypothetical protein